MKNLLFISLLSLFVAGFGACSPDTAGNAGGSNNKNTATAANLQENAPPVNPDSNTYPLANSINTANLQNSPGNKQVKAMPPAGRVLPDGSEIVTELGEVPVETRTFKGNSQIVKVVKSGLPSRATVKIYLKGGKVVEIPGDKVPNLSTAQAADLLNAAGVKPAATPAAELRPPVTKKVGEKP